MMKTLLYIVKYAVFVIPLKGTQTLNNNQTASNGNTLDFVANGEDPSI